MSYKYKNNNFIWQIWLDDLDKKIPEIGIWISEEEQWKWYWKEMLDSLIEQLKKQWEYDWIYYLSFCENEASIKLAKYVWWVCYWNWIFIKNKKIHFIYKYYIGL